MPRNSLTEIEKRLQNLKIGIQMQIPCNHGVILIVEKQTEHNNTNEGHYHAWIPDLPDGTNYNFTGPLSDTMALISHRRKRIPKP